MVRSSVSLSLVAASNGDTKHNLFRARDECNINAGITQKNEWNLNRVKMATPTHTFLIIANLQEAIPLKGTQKGSM